MLLKGSQLKRCGSKYLIAACSYIISSEIFLAFGEQLMNMSVSIIFPPSLGYSVHTVLFFLSDKIW